MERQKFRIKRKNAQFYGTPTCSTTGTTGLWPLNLSVPGVSGQTNACNNLLMYSSLGSEVQNALNGDMTTFPEELKDCSVDNPCAILWDVISPPFNNPTQCRNGDGNAWVQFKGLQYWSAGTPTIGTYNELIDIYQIYNADPTINILGQLGGWFTPTLTPCFCENTFAGQDLSAVDIFLTQDFNDIGHYSIWDGNISQKDVMSNFLFTSFTPYNVQVFNTTDFEYYKNLPSDFTIDWGDGNTSTLVGGNLTAVHPYANLPFTYIVTITQQTPWGPQSTSKSLTVPNLTYLNLLGQPYVPAGAGTGFGTGGLQEAQNQTTITGPPLYDPLTNLPIGNVGSATTFFGAYGQEGQSDYLPLDTGIDILQYTGMSPTPCFEVSGITESSIGAFQIYSSAPSNNPLLPPGYFENVMTPIGGDVENPLTNSLESQLEGMIFQVTSLFTGYTIQSTTTTTFSTPIDFYDFSNGITVFIAQSCGLNANSFGGEDCYKCPIEPCLYCEEKDEYIDRSSTPNIYSSPGQAQLISFNPGTNTNYAALGQPWSPNVDYVKGDIVFDITANLCCCFMAVRDINQSNPAFSSPWVAVPPALTNNGVWTDPTPGGIGEVHIWETCCYYPDCDCAPCPDGTLVPCNDPTLPSIWGGPNSNNGGVWQNGFNYTSGQFISDTHGNCYKALQSGPLGEPTGFTANLEWEYTGCISWICPTDPLNIGIYGCEPFSGASTTVINSYFPAPGMVFVGNAFYDSCLQDFNDGLCPYPERWVCDDQYSCGACIPIYPGQTSPMGYPYNFAGYPFSFVFSSQTDCNEWCNPPLYSCATPTAPCCTTIACNNQALYFTLTNMIPDGMSALDVLTNFNLYQAPTYSITDCQDDCCVETYDWDCELGCIMQAFSTIPPNPFGVGPVNGPQTLADCQALNGGGAPGVIQGVACGWSCTTPSAVYNPMPADPYGLGYYSSPCTPCYTNNCAPYPNEPACLSGCTLPEACYVCDCTTNTGYVLQNPCPTPTVMGGNLIGANNGIASDASGLLTYATPAAAVAADCCDSGWDCWVIADPADPNFGQPNGDGCTFYANWTMIPSNLSASTGGPYSSHTECCMETGCCYAECDWQIALTTSYSNTPQPTGFYPCVYMSALTSNFISCHPNNPAPASNANPYCSLADCYSDTNPGDDTDVKCEDPEADCVCCSAYTWSQYGVAIPLQDRGTYTFPGLNYQMWDTVTHFDADSPECCYVCMCPNLGGGAAGVGGVLDCDGFIPDDGPSGTGQPNCWENCTFKATNSTFAIDVNYDPVTGAVINVTPSHCPPCDPGYSAQTYECTDIGCQQSSCVINPAFSMTSQNCYDTPTCVGPSGLNECEAGCYCIEGPMGSPSTPWSTTGCVVLQDHLNNSDNIFAGGYPSFPPTVPPAGFPNNIIPWPLGTYPFGSLANCLTSLANGLDCCDEPRYYCDNLWQCGQSFAGTGCQPIYPGDPNYNIAPFTNLSDCQDYCTWECDPNGLGQCQFVANSTATVTFPSGPLCELTHINCDCKPPQIREWWCDNSGFIGTTPGTSNCISVINPAAPPNPLNSWGLLSPGFTQPCLYGTPNCYSFGTQSICEGYCRFCCDVAPPGTSFCQLDWGNQACDVSLYDCTQTSITLYGGYPCLGRPDVEFCCEPTQGCQSYIVGSPPAGCLGNYPSMNDCLTECNFLCDDCVPSCECVFTGPIPNGCDPLLITAYSSMTQCENAVIASIPPVIYGGKGCCDCYECYDQGGVYFQTLDSFGMWIGNNQTVTLTAVQNLSIWTSGVQYNIGDVVLAPPQPGADPRCCFVLVTDQAYNLTIEPSVYYTLYQNDVSNNQQTLNTSAVWIPCDTSCPVPSPMTGWECDPGFVNYTCLSKQAKYGDAFATCCGDCPGGGGGWSYSIPGVDVGRCTARVPRDVLRTVSDPLNNTGQFYNCPLLTGGSASVGPVYKITESLPSRYWEMPNTDGTIGGFNNVPDCCEGCNLLDDPNDFGGPDAGCLYNITRFFVAGNVDYINPMSANYCVQLTANFTQWAHFMSALNICGIHPGGTPWDASAGASYNCYFDDVETYLFTDPLWDNTPYPAMDYWLQIDWTYCTCVDQPCNCYEVTGATYTYASESACEQDCCQYYDCVQDPVSLDCSCVALPLFQVGPYPTLVDCQNDPLSCCNDRTCVNCIGQSFLIIKQVLDGTYNPYSVQSSVSLTITNPSGGITPWQPGMAWGFNEITIDPLDGCCYISIGDYGADPDGSLAQYPPSVCYDNFLLGLACDGSDINSPTQVTIDQGDFAVWWACDEDCAGIVPSGSGTGPCKKCCTNPHTGAQWILPVNTQPCECPQGWVDTPLADCGPQPSGDCCCCEEDPNNPGSCLPNTQTQVPNPNNFGCANLCLQWGTTQISSIHANFIPCGPTSSGDKCDDETAMVTAHIANPLFPTTYRYCKICSQAGSNNPSPSSAIAIAIGYCDCCDNIPWGTGPGFNDPLNPYAWI